MKVTKKNLKLGMRFDIKDKLECLRFSFDEDGHLKMRIQDHGELESNIPIAITGLIKKYRTGTGYSGDMVKFEVNGEEFLSFWIDFKRSTVFLNN